MFTDTDSLFYKIKTDNVYEDLLKDKELFDNSDYPKNSAFFFDKNKKVIGIIIIIIFLFQEDNIFGMNVSLTYSPRLQR